MSKKQEAHQEVDEQIEVSSEEEQSYEDMFDAQWGADVADTEDLPEPTPDEEYEDEQNDDPEQDDGDDGQEGLQEASPPAAPAPPPAPSDPYAWINSLPEEVREQAKALRNQANTHQGRAAAFQRRVNELNEELRRLEKDRAAAPADRQPQAPVSAAPGSLKKLEQLKEDFPEFAEALQEVISTERAAVEQRLKESLRPLEEERARKHNDDFFAAVDAEAQKIFNTPETGVHWKDIVEGNDFLAWLELQPKSVRHAATVADPEEAIFVLRKYEDDYQRAVKEMGLDLPGMDTAGTSSEEASRAEALKRKRQARKETSTAPGSRPADGNRDSHGGDYEELFNAMWS